MPRLIWLVARLPSYMVFLSPQPLRWPVKLMELPLWTLSVTCNVLFPLELDALVVRQLDVHVLAGNSFIVQNEILVSTQPNAKL